MELGLERVTTNHYGYSRIICSTCQPLIKAIECWPPAVRVVLVDASKAKLRAANRQKRTNKSKVVLFAVLLGLEVVIYSNTHGLFDACKRKMHDNHGIDKLTRQTDIFLGNITGRPK